MAAVLDVLSLCNFCILSNVLDPRTYNFADLQYGHVANATHLSQRRLHDYNALSPDDRHYFSYVRGLAINLIQWINCHYLFDDEDPITIARQYLHQQIRAIIGYKVEAEKENVQGIPNCGEIDLRRQISLLFADGMADFGGLSLNNLENEESLAWDTDFIPAERTEPLEFIGICYCLNHGAQSDSSHIERDAQVLGTTKGDKMFHAGSAHAFPLSTLSTETSDDLPLNNEPDNDMDQDQEAGGNDMEQEAGDNENAGDDDEEEDDEDDSDSDGMSDSSDMEYENWDRKGRR